MTDDQSGTITNTVLPPVVLSAQTAIPLDQNPATIYLASLGEGSRRTMHTALNTIAGLLGVGEIRDVAGQDVRCLAVPWGNLRSQHTAAIRMQLQARSRGSFHP